MKRFLLIVLLLVTWPAFGQLLERRPAWEPIQFPVSFFKVQVPTDTLSFYILGDIMSHGAVVRSAAKWGYEGFFKHIAPQLEGADVAIGNLEFPLAGKPYTGYPAFSGPDTYAQYLSDIGLDVFLTANNHILDKGNRGLTRTIGQLEERGLLYTGISASEGADTLLNPLFLSVKGVRVAIVNATYGTNLGASARWPTVHYLREEALAPVMRRARQADIVLVFPHWGIEYAACHSPEQERMARWFIDQGAHVIVGAHPHVVQDVQRIDGVPVFYSLGNAISNQNDAPARLEAALTLRFVLRLGEPPHLLEPSLEYLWCAKPGMVEDSFTVVPVSLPDSCWRVAADYMKMVQTLAR